MEHCLVYENCSFQILEQSQSQNRVHYNCKFFRLYWPVEFLWKDYSCRRRNGSVSERNQDLSSLIPSSYPENQTQTTVPVTLGPQVAEMRGAVMRVLHSSCTPGSKRDRGSGSKVDSGKHMRPHTSLYPTHVCFCCVYRSLQTFQKIHFPEIHSCVHLSVSQH